MSEARLHARSAARRRCSSACRMSAPRSRTISCRRSCRARSRSRTPTGTSPRSTRSRASSARACSCRAFALRRSTSTARPRTRRCTRARTTPSCADALLHRRPAVSRRPRPRRARDRAPRAARTGGRTTTRSRPSSRGSSPTHGHAILWDGHSIQAGAAVAVRGPPARPQPRHRRRRELRAGAARRADGRCSPRSERSRTSPTAASRAATSRATTAGPRERRARGPARDVPRDVHGRDARRACPSPQPIRRASPACGRCCAPRADDARLAARMAAETPRALLWAPLAWLPDGWRENVVLRVARDGRWAEVTPGVASAPDGARVVAGPLLPGARRRAQPRVPARLRRRRRAARRARSDDFWSWRERMYAVALRMSPAQLRAVAAQLYVELLRGGYTHVCEFHYLRRDRDGSEYADPLAMSWALADAAADAGIGLTILPVLYERAGFAAARCAPSSGAFALRRPTTLDAAQRDSRRARGRSSMPALAIHSLRAASATSIARAARALAEGSPGRSTSTSPSRPARSTSASRDTARGRSSGSLGEGRSRRALAARPRDPCDRAARSPRSRRAAPAIVLCPSTEANLGDGVLRPARLARRRRADVDRLRQPGDARLARGAAPARIRPAAGAAPAQRRRRARARRRVERRAARLAHARRRRRRGRPAGVGARRRRARRCARRRSARPMRCWASRRSDRSTRSSSAARPRRGAT